jgi:hypothetical protein
MPSPTAVRSVGPCGRSGRPQLLPGHGATLGHPGHLNHAGGDEALHHLGLRRVVVTSPYPDSHHEAERVYLAQTGIEAIAMHGMGLRKGRSLPESHPKRSCSFLWRPGTTRPMACSSVA